MNVLTTTVECLLESVLVFFARTSNPSAFVWAVITVFRVAIGLSARLGCLHVGGFVNPS